MEKTLIDIKNNLTMENTNSEKEEVIPENPESSIQKQNETTPEDIYDKRSSSENTGTNQSEQTKNEDDEFIFNHLFLNKPESQEVIVAIVGSDNKLVASFSQQISDIYLKKGFAAITSIFSNSFYSSGKFDQVYNGNQDLLAKMSIGKYTDYLAIGKVDFTFKQNTIDNTMTTATANFEFKMISVIDGTSNQSMSKTVAGTGWSAQTAQDNAQNNLVSLLTKLL